MLLNFNVDITNNEKEDFEILCDELGINPDTVINIFIKKMLREKGVPFEISLNNKY